MKQVYYISYEEYLNDIKIDCWRYPHWHYGEPKEREDITLTVFDDAWNNYGIALKRDRTLFRNRRLLQGYDAENIFRLITVNEKTFKSYRIVEKLVVVGHYTMEDLMKELSAEEFVEYCKDNNMVICPINK